MCGDCSLTVLPQMLFFPSCSSLVQVGPDDGGLQCRASPASFPRMTYDFYGLKKNKGDKQECIWLISLSTVMSCLTFQRVLVLVSLCSSLPPLYPPCGVSLAFPPHSRAAHLTEPDTEICAANSLHSHGSVWCHNWHTIDLCLLLQRPEWLMSRASCHNRPCPGLLPLGCSPHFFLSSAICCG